MINLTVYFIFYYPISLVSLANLIIGFFKHQIVIYITYNPYGKDTLNQYYTSTQLSQVRTQFHSSLAMVHAFLIRRWNQLLKKNEYVSQMEMMQELDEHPLKFIY